MRRKGRDRKEREEKREEDDRELGETGKDKGLNVPPLFGPK